MLNSTAKCQKCCLNSRTGRIKRTYVPHLPLPPYFLRPRSTAFAFAVHVASRQPQPSLSLSALSSQLSLSHRLLSHRPKISLNPCACPSYQSLLLLLPFFPFPLSLSTLSYLSLFLLRVSVVAITIPFPFTIRIYRCMGIKL